LDDQDEKIRAASEQIQRYLEEHPGAADSLDGIATWWVARQVIAKELSVVRAALERLVEAGVVTAERREGAGEPVYRMARSGVAQSIKRDLKRKE
jgi:hypothetical protein